VITADDRERIMETERTLMESMCSIMSEGESEGEGGKVEGRRASEKVQDRKEIEGEGGYKKYKRIIIMSLNL
jgi:hypothetical protein